MTALPHPVSHQPHINLPSALSFSACLDVDVGVGVQEPPEHGGVVGHDAGDAAAEGPLVGGLRVEHPHVHPDAPGAQVLEQPRGKPTCIGWLWSFTLLNAIAVVSGSKLFAFYLVFDLYRIELWSTNCTINPFKEFVKNSTAVFL